MKESVLSTNVQIHKEESVCDIQIYFLLERMWRKRNLPTLLVATKENSLEVTQKTKSRVAT